MDLNYEGLVRDVCPSVMERGVSVSSEPFGLGFDGSATPGLTLRACGRDRVETISRCLSVCVSPQLGSRYVTWGEEDVVFAYLPRIRRRVAIGRAPGLNAYSTVRSIAHTCNRVFAQWAYTIYVARFEPRRGAPPCQSRR